jgi:hypothetical protein
MSNKHHGRSGRLSLQYPTLCSRLGLLIIIYKTAQKRRFFAVCAGVFAPVAG